MYYVARCVMHGRKQAQHCELLLAKVAEAKERAAAGFACIRVAIALVHYSLRCSTKQGRAERSCTLLHPSLAVRHSTPNTLAYSRPRAPGARVALACALMLVICFCFYQDYGSCASPSGPCGMPHGHVTYDWAR